MLAVAATNPAGTAASPATATSCSVTIGNWGTQTLSVEALDLAGNVTQTFQYTFYVPWSGAAAHDGDVNGDGFPDLLATTANGDLVLYPGHTDPNATPQLASVPADSPQSGTGWNNYQITHRGSFSQQSIDDLFALRGAILYRYLNNTQTGTAPQFENPANLRQVNYPTCPQPLMEGDPDNPNDCAGYPTGWSQFAQIVAPGDAWAGAPAPTAAQPYATFGIAEDDTDPSLLAVSKAGQLWLFQGNGAGQLENPVLLGSSGWNSMTVIAPGVVNGHPVLWARDTVSGALFSYPFGLSAHNVPTLNPSNPASPVPAEGTGTTGTALPGAPTLTGSAFPTLTAALPLATGTGGCSTANPGYYCTGLYAVDASGNIWYYSGQAVTGTGGPLSASPQLYVSALTPAGYWPLGDSQSGSCLTTASDASGHGLTGTLNGTATCEADPAGTAGQPNPTMVDSFDGTSGFISAAGPALATGAGKSFTVSAWVYLTANTQFAAAVSQDTTAGDAGGSTNSAFKLMYRVSDNVWALSRPAANTPGALVISAESAPLTSASLNTWTQLTGTYNATSGLMSIYVNGQLQGTATDTTPFTATGATIIGRDLFSSTFDDFFPGKVSDVQLFGYALSPPAVQALYQGQDPINQIS